MKTLSDFNLNGFGEYKTCFHEGDFDKPQFLIISHQKCVILYAPKLCSSLIKKASKIDSHVGLNVNPINIFESPISWFPSDDQLSKIQIDYLAEVKKDIESIKNDTIKKDIIILFREPYKRFVSAFTQDFVKRPLTDMSLYFFKHGKLPSVNESWFNDMGIRKEDIPYTINFLQNYISFDNNIPDRILKYRNQLIETLVYNALSHSNLFSTHHRPNLSSVVRFLDKLNRSRSKVKLLNMDNVNVSQYLSTYDDLYKNTDYVNRAIGLTNTVSELILYKFLKNEINGDSLISKLNTTLYYEYEYYFKLLTDYQDLIYTPNVNNNE